MLAAGGILAMLMMGFAVSGLFSSDDVSTESETDPDGGAGDEAETLGSDDAAGEGSMLADLFFGSDASDETAEEEEAPLSAKAGFLSDDAEASDDETDPEDPGTVDGERDSLDGSWPGDDGDPTDPEDGDGDAIADIFEITATTGGPDGEDIPVVTEFQPGIDRLILDFEGTEDQAPIIGLDTESQPGHTLVTADGLAVTAVEGGAGIGEGDIEVRMSGATASGAGSENADQQLDGTDGNDTLTGGDGNDTLDGYSGDDLLNGGTGDDLLRGREGMDSLFGEGGEDAITGGIGDDEIDGGSQNDALFGNEGNDNMIGGGGADELYGDEGDDTLEGGQDADFLVGGDGDDLIKGDEGRDLLFGNDGDDVLEGGADDDFLQGGFGADTLHGGDGNDRLDGTFAAGDSIFGPFDEDAADQLFGGDGDDSIVVGAGDTAIGGDGADTFLGGAYIETAEVAGLVEDFDQSQDVIEVMFDPDLTPDPEITVEDFADGTGANVLLDGQVILRVSGAQGLSADAIELREVRMDPVPEPA